MPQTAPAEALDGSLSVLFWDFSFFFLCYAVDLELGQVFIHAVIQHCTTVGFLL